MASPAPYRAAVFRARHRHRTSPICADADSDATTSATADARDGETDAEMYATPSSAPLPQVFGGYSPDGLGVVAVDAMLKDHEVGPWTPPLCTST